MQRQWNLIIHPFLFFIYALLALFSSNINEININVMRTIIYIVFFTLLILVFVNVLVKNKLKSGLLTSGIILSITSYGHIESLVSDFMDNLPRSATQIFTLLFFFTFLVIYTYVILKKVNHPVLINIYLNWVSLILIIFPLYRIWNHYWYAKKVNLSEEMYLERNWDISAIKDISLNENLIVRQKPDIYYIILDAYTRDDILQEVYKYDSSEFINFLKSNGFYIADASRANYYSTDLSIASSLNMLDLNTAPEFLLNNAGMVSEYSIHKIAGQLIQDNRVALFLRDHGYTFVNFDSGYDTTTIKSANILMSLDQESKIDRNEFLFNMMFLDTTIGRVYLNLRGEDYRPLQALFDEHRERVLFTIDHISDFASKEGNYFIFAHIVSPHVPYVFGPNGETILSNDPYTLLDNNPGQKENVSLYSGQVHYINKLLMRKILEIISISKEPPIIILQGDHSSKVYSGPEPDPLTRMKLLFPILNAFLIPKNNHSVLYRSITPINTFRIIFNNYFGTNLELLPDNSYLLENKDGNATFTNACMLYPELCIR